MPPRPARRRRRTGAPEPGSGAPVMGKRNGGDAMQGQEYPAVGLTDVSVEDRAEAAVSVLSGLLDLDLPEGTLRPLAILSEYGRRYPRARKHA